MSESNNFDLIIGSYSDGKDQPSVYHFKSSQKKAFPILSEINPSFVLKHNGHYYITTQHQKGLIVVVDSEFKTISRIQSLGDDPCHLSIDNTGNYLVGTNYSSGSIIIAKLQNHKPSAIHSFITLEGSGGHPTRQTSPHPHSSVFSEDNSILFVADLGTDLVYYYEFNEQTVKWVKEKSLKIEAAGPRTLANGKKGSKSLFLTCELDNTVRVLSYKGPGLEQMVAYKLSTNENNFLSEIRYLNNQVFVALRGDDKMIVFDEKEDKLETNCSFKVAAFPRHFSLTEDGYLFVAGQKANLVQKYRITAQKILLLSQIEITSPSCIVVL